MERNNFDNQKEPEIVYSRSMKAGRRIYYLDVKKARNDDLYICITESKRVMSDDEEFPQFEKHKIFLYKEDFSNFMNNLQDAVEYVRSQFPSIEDRDTWPPYSHQSDSFSRDED